VILAKLLGAEVIACASSADKMRRLKELGADEVVDYTKTDWSKWAVEKYGKPQRRSYDGGVDVVINFTGGDTWATVASLHQAGRQAAGVRRDRRPRPERRPALYLELRDRDQGLEQLLRRRPRRADGADPAEEDRAGDRQGASRSNRRPRGLRLIRDREIFGKVVVTP
jgi:alcohol dehydrogenase